MSPKSRRFPLARPATIRETFGPDDAFGVESFVLGAVDSQSASTELGHAGLTYGKSSRYLWRWTSRLSSLLVPKNLDHVT